MGLLEDTADRLREALAGRGPEQARGVVPPAPLGAHGHRVPPGLVQPDQTTCGSACLVMARILGDPAYAAWIRTGEDSRAARDPRTAQRRFADEALATHVRTNRSSNASGALQLPWPRQLGTTPWSLATELRITGGTAPPGTRHQVWVVSPRRRGESFDAAAAVVGLGHVVALFIGNRLRPGHVVLATARTGDALTLYDPATGRTPTLTRDAFASGSLGVSGWDEPWFTVSPSS
jgi:hypothetical protein